MGSLTLRRLAGVPLLARLRLRRRDDVLAQLRTAEELYRGLVENLPLATYVDRPGAGRGTSWISRQIGEITSYEVEEWAADPTLFEKALHPDDRQRVLDEKAQAQRTGEPVDQVYRMVRRDGSTVWIHDSAVTLGTGDSLHARGFVVDVTARREAELELERQNEQLRQLDVLKDEFIALVSHELRTPLTSIRGYVDLLVEDDLTEEQAQFVDTIDRNAQRLERVVGDLLFCAQLEAGKLSLEDGPVDVNELVSDAVDAGRPLATARAIELTADLDELPTIRGDRARLAQVLDNFVSNAIKFTPSEGSVSVATRRLPGEVEITIADTGIGIPEHELPRLFQRFFRTEHATTAAIPGTGLGLAIAKSIVDGHGGKVRVQSEDGVGTTFRLLLPG